MVVNNLTGALIITPEVVINLTGALIITTGVVINLTGAHITTTGVLIITAEVVINCARGGSNREKNNDNKIRWG